MSILDNAVNSISIGIDDYQTNQDERLASCVRNLFSGILLLFKHHLAELSPKGSNEVLLMSHVFPSLIDGILVWRGKGKKTVEYHQIRERFKALGVSVDWQRVEKIKEYRNNVEHYYTTANKDAVRLIISNSFIVIRDFVREVLKKKPESIFPPEAWASLTKVNEVYKKEKSVCVSHIYSVKWEYSEEGIALSEADCPKCSSGLIDTNSSCSDPRKASFTCLSCHAVFPYEKFAPAAILNFLNYMNERAARDGDEPASISCPICGEGPYLIDSDICVTCEESSPRSCDECGCTIPSSERNAYAICGYCEHRMGKE